VDWIKFARLYTSSYGDISGELHHTELRKPNSILNLHHQMFRPTANNTPTTKINHRFLGIKERHTHPCTKMDSPRQALFNLPPTIGISSHHYLPIFRPPAPLALTQVAPISVASTQPFHFQSPALNPSAPDWNWPFRSIFDAEQIKAIFFLDATGTE
jgi:hypothetical protein